ncbi:MAG: methylated-DNA--[protein]-cysteine S-methyltransferase [Candidatus Hermodarchaeota archaeon]
MLDFIEKNKLTLKNTKDSIEKDLTQNLITLLEEYLSGKKINLYNSISAINIKIDLKEKFTTEFSLKVVEYLINKVKYGTTTSYSEIAEYIGSKAYRAVGNVMRCNPLPLIIPCHRVLKKDGDLGGFGGYFNNEWQHKLKSDLLEIESLKK